MKLSKSWRKLLLVFVFVIILFLINIIVLNTTIDKLHKLTVDPSSALAILSTMAKISGTILSIFFAGYLFLFRSEETRKLLSKHYAIGSGLLLVSNIVSCLFSMILIEQNTPVPGSYIFFPTFWFCFSFGYISAFVWHLHNIFAKEETDANPSNPI